jgi:hypothetical protein
MQHAMIVQLLKQRFGPEWDALTAEQRRVVLIDFADLLSTEYDIGDCTVADCIEQENAEEAAREYRRRIGGGNLESYAKVLLVPARKK